MVVNQMPFILAKDRRTSFNNLHLSISIIYSFSSLFAFIYIMHGCILQKHILLIIY